MKTIILYHRDMDGLASALIARKRYPDAELKSVQYGEDIIDINTIKNYEDKRVILVDFSFNDIVMSKLIEKTKEFIWIDHHKSAKEKLSEIWDSKDIKGIRSTDKSACELTWYYFNPDADCPYGIELIGDRDTWTFKYKEDTKYFCEYLRQYDIETDINSIEMEIFEDEDNINSCIDEGESFYNAMMSEVKRLYKKGDTKHISYSINKRYSTFICYSNSYISELADYALEQGDCDIAEIRQRIYTDQKGWQTIVSLRSKGTIDVSLIAKEHGGGGHKNAAGYVLI